jgi:hypothetical protein
MEKRDYIDMEDLFVDDILEDAEKKERKPKLKSKQKGNRVELELCKKLTEHFGDEFSRSVGSGNRWGQVNYLPEHARKTLVGDLCVPEKFKWVIECKGGYDNDVDFSSVLDGGCARIDEFLTQSEFDAGQCGRFPIIFWKRSRKPWVSLLRKIDMPTHSWEYIMQYRDWMIVSTDALLANTKRTFWFEK